MTSVTEESSIETDNMIPLFELSNNSDLDTTDSTDLSTMVPANRKMSCVKKVAAIFAKLSHHHAGFTDESMQWLKQLDNSTSLDNLMPGHSSVGCIA